MEQLKFIGKRLVYLVVMLFGVATLVFILTKMIPGDPTVANLSQRALNDPEIVAAYRAKYGLDQPLPVQYILYMKNLLQFDLGTSMRTNKPVLSELARCYPATIELALFAIVIAAILDCSFLALILVESVSSKYSSLVPIHCVCSMDASSAWVMTSAPSTSRYPLFRTASITYPSSLSSPTAFQTAVRETPSIPHSCCPDR